MMNEISLDKPLAAGTSGPSLEDFLSTLRHQLGNSVNALKVTLDVLNENFDLFNDEKKKEYLQRAQEVLARQQSLIDAMRSYSNVRVDDRKPVDFVSFWESFLEAVRRRTKTVTMNPDLNKRPCQVMGSPIAIQTVLIQLLENALDAVEGMDDQRIELSVTEEAEWIRIDVKDHGCGIRKTDMNRIFLPLFTTKPKRKGLGLPIAQKLTAQMGGRLEIVPVAEGGTAATLWLQRVGGEKNGQAIHQ